MIMPTLRTPLDYFNAIRVAVRRGSFRYPNAIYSVLASRFYHGLGPRLHSLFNLIDVPRDRWNDYLVDERLRVVLRSINQPAVRDLVNDKLAFHDHCVDHSLPTIPVICAIQEGDGSHPKSFATVETEGEWCDWLDGAPDRVFVKLIDGTWGMDAFIAERKEEQWHYAGNYGSAVDFHAFLRQRLGSNRGWMVQPLIEAHTGLKSIISSRALPTIRANTCFVNGQPRLLFAVLRIPVGDNITDNFAHGTSGNIIAPIDVDTGRLGRCRGSASTRWPDIVDVSVHPDTGNTIEGCHIPMWEEVLTLLERGQESLSNLRTLGWDVAVTDDGPLIVEANATYDVDLIQVAHQRGVKPQLEEVFSAWSGVERSGPANPETGKSEIVP